MGIELIPNGLLPVPGCSVSCVQNWFRVAGLAEEHQDADEEQPNKSPGVLVAWRS